MSKAFGRSIRVLVGEQSAAYSTFALVLRATVEQAEVTLRSVTLRVKDNQEKLSNPLPLPVFAGSNALPNGAEGTADDLKGQRKPRMYGKVFNVSPPVVNSSLLMFQMNSGSASIQAVYDKAVALTFHDDYANLAALEAATVPSGSYSTCAAIGLFRLGSNHVGTVTCDATAGSEYLAEILGAIATDAGVTMSSSDIAALKAVNPALGGIYFQDSSTEAGSGTTALQLPPPHTPAKQPPPPPHVISKSRAKKVSCLRNQIKNFQVIKPKENNQKTAKTPPTAIRHPEFIG
jgi:hypothetical protein